MTKFTSHSRMDGDVKTAISGYKHMEHPPHTYYSGEDIISLLKSLITAVAALKILFGEAKEVRFRYFVVIKMRVPSFICYICIFSSDSSISRFSGTAHNCT